MRNRSSIGIILLCLILFAPLSTESGEVRHSTADVVLGQPNFFGNAPNYNAKDEKKCDALGMHHPTGISIGFWGHHPCYLAVADTNNNRIMIWGTLESYWRFKKLGVETGQAASHVFGQPDFFTNSSNSTRLNGNSFDHPYDVCEGRYGFYVADTGNNRIVHIKWESRHKYLEFNFLYGQEGPKVKKGIKVYAIDGTTLMRPKSVTNSFISDFYNHRILFVRNLESPWVSTPWESAREPIQILGQDNMLASREWNYGGVGNSSLAFPRGITQDKDENLYVADFDNHRVLIFRSDIVREKAIIRSPVDLNADVVLGQRGDFTSRIPNKGGVSEKSLFFPADVAVDPNGHLYVADMGNHRVLRFNKPLEEDDIPDMVFGQLGEFATRDENKGGLGPDSLAYPSGVACDNQGTLYISDTHNNRVLVFYAEERDD